MPLPQRLLDHLGQLDCCVAAKDLPRESHPRWQNGVPVGHPFRKKDSACHKRLHLVFAAMEDLLIWTVVQEAALESGEGCEQRNWDLHRHCAFVHIRRRSKQQRHS